MSNALKSRPYFRVPDLIIIAIVILTTLGGFFILGFKAKGTTPEYAYIRVNSEITDTIDLRNVSESYPLTVEGNFPVTLEVSKEGVRFVDSQCKDKLCIHSGLLSSGESAACLPAGVSVSVSGSEPEIDAIVG